MRCHSSISSRTQYLPSMPGLPDCRRGVQRGSAGTDRGLDNGIQRIPDGNRDDDPPLRPWLWLWVVPRRRGSRYGGYAGIVAVSPRRRASLHPRAVRCVQRRSAGYSLLAASVAGTRGQRRGRSVRSPTEPEPGTRGSRPCAGTLPLHGRIACLSNASHRSHKEPP